MQEGGLAQSRGVRMPLAKSMTGAGVALVTPPRAVIVLHVLVLPGTELQEPGRAMVPILGLASVLRVGSMRVDMAAAAAAVARIMELTCSAGL